MKLTELPPSIILRSIASGMLLLALAPLPYGYYILLRWITCGVGAYTVSLASNQSKKAGQIIFGVVALIFNPIIPFRFDRETWAVIDIVASVIFIASIFYVRETVANEPDINLGRHKRGEPSETLYHQEIADEDAISQKSQVESKGGQTQKWEVRTEQRSHFESSMSCPKCKRTVPSHKFVCDYCGFDRRDKMCPTCGETIVDEAVFCSQCGNKIVPSLCEKCGTQNDERAKYCFKCGNSLRG